MLITFLILTLLTMAIDAIGFKRFIWFISIGYGYSVAGIALAVAIIHFHSLTWAMGLMLLLLIFYGCRLATYLRRLELRQDHNYGADEAYLRYKKSTPILLPFVPIYSVKNQTWLVG